MLQKLLQGNKLRTVLLPQETKWVVPGLGHEGRPWALQTDYSLQNGIGGAEKGPGVLDWAAIICSPAPEEAELSSFGGATHPQGSERRGGQRFAFQWGLSLACGIERPAGHQG